jgi:tellurite resistance protein TerC
MDVTRSRITGTHRTARRIAIGVLGATVVLAGVVMILLPGPALVVIPAGLAILGVEYAWARRWLQRLRRESERITAKWRRRAIDARGPMPTPPRADASHDHAGPPATALRR